VKVPGEVNRIRVTPPVLLLASHSSPLWE
jgi:hypothetical protein